MFNWLWKRLGYHVCEEYTRWELKEHQNEEAPSMTERLALGIQKKVTTIRWQERQCTICGKIEQRVLCP